MTLRLMLVTYRRQTPGYGVPLISPSRRAVAGGHLLGSFRNGGAG